MSQEMKHTKEDLTQMQSLPLEAKIVMTQRRIREWYEYWGGQVYVSFSGGKDSTVLLHLVREMYPDVEAVYVDTGLEYPEIRHFVKTFDNVTILHPNMRFDEVIKTYGYPLISKEVSQRIHEFKVARTNWAQERWDKVGIYANKAPRYDLTKWKPLRDSSIPVSHMCCKVMKKKPAKDFEKQTGKKPILATMASESVLRKTQWMKNGCNAFDAKRKTSQPMSFWTEQDVLQYIKQNNLPIATVYGDIVPCNKKGDKFCTTGCSRTGCIFCAFGCHLEKEPSRFQRLKETHPRQYEYCIEGGEYNENGIWIPNKQGLGMGHVFDEINKIYGEGFIKYK